MAGKGEHKYDDLFRTSYGVGVDYRPGFLQGLQIDSTIGRPLPPVIRKKDLPIEEERFKTTNAATYDWKFSSAPYKQQDPVQYLKPLDMSKANYIMNTTERVQSGVNGGLALDPRNQISTYAATYTAPKGLSDPENFPLPMKKTLSPLWDILSNRERETLKVHEHEMDPGVADLLDPYLTSSLKTHRKFCDVEVKSLPVCDQVSYWSAEDYPKVRGYGPAHNPLAKSLPRIQHEPMTDERFFKYHANIRNVPKRNDPLPNSHMKTVYSEAYPGYSDPRSKESTFHPVDHHMSFPKPGSGTAYMVPFAYQTESSNIGSRNPRQPSFERLRNTYIS